MNLNTNLVDSCLLNRDIVSEKKKLGQIYFNNFYLNPRLQNETT